MKNRYIANEPTEPLILEPDDWTEDEWCVLLKLFGMESAEKMEVTYKFRAFGVPNKYLKDAIKDQFDRGVK